MLNIDNLKGTETERNLYKTFAFEARTNNLYMMFAEVARNEGYRWIAEKFEKIAANELGHAKAAYKKHLGKVKKTKENVIASMEREDDVAELYREFQKTAEKEGLDKIASFYKELREIEEEHEKVFRDLVIRFKKGCIFYSEEPINWVCMNCGYIHEGNRAPDDCPCCGYPQSYFMPECKPE